MSNGKLFFTNVEHPELKKKECINTFGFFYRIHKDELKVVSDDKWRVTFTTWRQKDYEIVRNELRYHEWADGGSIGHGGRDFHLPAPNEESAVNFAVALSHCIHKAIPTNHVQIMVFANHATVAKHHWIVNVAGVFKKIDDPVPEENNDSVTLDDFMLYSPEQNHLYDSYNERISALIGRINQVPFDDTMYLLGEIVQDENLPEILKDDLYAKIERFMEVLGKIIHIFNLVGSNDNVETKPKAE